MFDKHRSLFLRGLSLFHGWLPFLLLYLVWEMGYDSRALIAWTIVSCIVLPICYFLMPKAQPDPGMTPVNINLVWGFDDRKAADLDVAECVVRAAVFRAAGCGLLADASAAAVCFQAGGVNASRSSCCHGRVLCHREGVASCESDPSLTLESPALRGTSGEMTRDQSGLMPASFATLPHLSISLWI